MADRFAPQALSMDNEDAKFLFKTGAAILFFNVPIGTEVGIDYNAWQIGPKFKGIKLIPPGLHFLYYSAVGRDGQIAPRTGLFRILQPTEIVVKEWDVETEDAVDMTDKEQEARLAMAILEFDPFLGTYPLDTYNKWRSLTNYVTQTTLDRSAPRNGKIYSVTRVTEEDNEDNSNTDDALRFVAIPKQRYPKGASAADVTRYGMDSSWLLQHMLEKYYKKDYKLLLGELQFAFICFLVGQVFDAFERWKSLVALFCTCDEALVTHPELFCAFTDVLHWQLNETPEDFFLDIVSQNNFLTTILQKYISTAEQDVVPTVVRSRVQRLHSCATERFKWDFTAEDDEDLPVIVET